LIFNIIALAPFLAYMPIKIILAIVFFKNYLPHINPPAFTGVFLFLLLYNNHPVIVRRHRENEFLAFKTHKLVRVFLKSNSAKDQLFSSGAAFSN